MSFEAKYPGRCADCDEGIRVGDQIRRVDDWVAHIDCDDAAPSERPINETCPDCWLIKPCECDS